MGSSTSKGRRDNAPQQSLSPHQAPTVPIAFPEPAIVPLSFPEPLVPLAVPGPEAILMFLTLYDTVIIVDDSDSMYGNRWVKAGEALQDLARVASQYDEDGLDILFLNSLESEEKVKDPQRVEKLFKRVQPIGATPIGKRIRELLEKYLKQYKETPHLKRVNYIVITDGEATDKHPDNNVETVIVKFAREFERLNAPISQVGIQFVQIGADEEARQFLEMLDDNLKEKHGIRDIVDTSVNRTDEPLDLIKTLLGAINKRVDGGQVVAG
ncbi:hypothetical protein BDN72DRAFT_828200 [Pluteus cervinus]|uniref:Uncharacterized protein n=1 Tax=Pluteus cervinus TaxID=181527 RepID=A0ACD3A745_9AGAR|nr:hypothetical protein BDN72DRAFT_828200 [Pluteus cervinus]